MAQHTESKVIFGDVKVDIYSTSYGNVAVVTDICTQWATTPRAISHAHEFAAETSDEGNTAYDDFCRAFESHGWPVWAAPNQGIPSSGVTSSFEKAAKLAISTANNFL